MLLVLACIGAAPLAAQRPAGADSMTAAAAAESLAVLKTLDVAVKNAPHDAHLWLRRGLLAWSLSERDQHGASRIKGVDWTLMRRMADTSLRIALQLAPDDPKIAMALGQLHIASGLITTRIQSYGMFETALEVGRSSGDPELISEAAIEVGRVHWRRYEPVSHRPFEAEVFMEARALAQNLARDTLGGRSRVWDPDTATRRQRFTRQALQLARDSIDRITKRPEAGFAGEADFIRAEQYFREAYNVMPFKLRTFRHLAMLLAERERWTELRTLARDQLNKDLTNSWAWMSMGLASHRMGDDRMATLAFDSALVMMPPGERARLDNFERLTRPLAAAQRTGWADSTRAAYANTFWRALDPLWSRDEEQPRTEFLARVAYAELRWTVDEMMARGADTDRGEIHIRYGPPDVIVTDEVFTRWVYDYANLGFTFIGMPTFGTSYHSAPWGVAQVVDSAPSFWNNINSVRIDSIPVGITRFRAGRDSADVVMTAWPDIDRIGAAADLVTPVRSDAWLLYPNLVPIWHDSVPVARAGSRLWRHQLAAGEYLFRTEAVAEASRIAGRAFAPVRIVNEPDGFTLRGFGLSDLLLAQQPGPVATADRWHQLGVTPIAPRIPGGTFALIWETYDLAERDGEASFEIRISIRPLQSGFQRIYANTIGAVRGLIGVEQLEGRVEIRFARNVAHRDVIVEQYGLDLSENAPGVYEMIVEVRDRFSDRTTRRTTTFILPD
jgi:GWxTD domain-containing protein